MVKPIIIDNPRKITDPANAQRMLDKILVYERRCGTEAVAVEVQNNSLGAIYTIMPRSKAEGPQPLSPCEQVVGVWSRQYFLELTAKLLSG